MIQSILTHYSLNFPDTFLIIYKLAADNTQRNIIHFVENLQQNLPLNANLRSL